LFRLANHHEALVLGTGDLSELALGWATYGVGDQMSHYNVNGSVPKTLIQHVIRWVVDSAQFDAATGETLMSILGTEISPELVPHREGDSGKPAQSTQEKIGPYELQDFHLYYITRFGFRPSKVAYLAHHAWSEVKRGSWPELLPVDKRREYDLATIKKWLEVFLFRFFQISQFKRSAIPNGPKVGSGGSLSPRGDWRAPSDSESAVWLEELRANVPDDRLPEAGGPLSRPAYSVNGRGNVDMTHAERILMAVETLSGRDGSLVFSQDEIRHQAGLDRTEWNRGYSAIFQAMRADHPGGAPSIRQEFRGVFTQVAHGKHKLSDYGRTLIKERFR
jgi:NH3-dependent NAD+ synthetase